MALPLRVRILGAAIQKAVGPYAAMPEKKRQTLRRRTGPRWIGDFLNGAPEPTVTITDETVPGPTEDIQARLYRPRGAGSGDHLPAVVVLPGGGFVFGDKVMTTWLSSHLAAGLGAVVVSPGYRLAPEHAAPAAGEDCYAVTAWMADQAERFGGDGRRLAVVGESAGATLTAVTCLMARERGGPVIRAQGLLQGAFDLRPGAPMMTASANWPFGSPADAPNYVAAYLGEHGDPADPLISPLLATDHTGLPSAFVLTADHDYLHDDGVRYAEALRMAGVRVKHAHFTDSPHGIFSFPGWCKASGPALEQLTEFLRSELSPVAPGEPVP